MKITKQHLTQLIKEEVIRHDFGAGDRDTRNPQEAIAAAIKNLEQASKDFKRIMSIRDIAYGAPSDIAQAAAHGEPIESAFMRITNIIESMKEESELFYEDLQNIIRAWEENS